MSWYYYYYFVLYKIKIIVKTGKIEKITKIDLKLGIFKYIITVFVVRDI